MSEIKYCVGTIAFYEKTIEEVLPIVREIGFEAIDIWGGKMFPLTHMSCEFSKQEREKIISQARELNINIPSLQSAFLNKFDDKDEKVREQAVKQVKATIDLADELGAKVMQIVPLINKENFEQVMPYIKESVKYAEQKNIILALENHCGSFSGSVEGAMKICEDLCSKNMGIIYEPANLYKGGVDYKKVMDIESQYIVHAHLKDGYIRQYDNKEILNCTVYGKGELDIPWIIKNLSRIGYSGYINVEYESWHKEYGLPEPFIGLKQCLEYLNNIKEM